MCCQWPLRRVIRLVRERMRERGVYHYERQNLSDRWTTRRLMITFCSLHATQLWWFLCSLTILALPLMFWDFHRKGYDLHYQGACVWGSRWGAASHAC